MSESPSGNREGSSEQGPEDLRSDTTKKKSAGREWYTGLCLYTSSTHSAHMHYALYDIVDLMHGSKFAKIFSIWLHDHTYCLSLSRNEGNNNWNNDPSQLEAGIVLCEHYIAADICCKIMGLELVELWLRQRVECSWCQ